MGSSWRGLSDPERDLHEQRFFAILLETLAALSAKGCETIWFAEMPLPDDQRQLGQVLGQIGLARAARGGSCFSAAFAPPHASALASTNPEHLSVTIGGVERLVLHSSWSAVRVWLADDEAVEMRRALEPVCVTAR